MAPLLQAEGLGHPAIPVSLATVLAKEALQQDTAITRETFARGEDSQQDMEIIEEMEKAGHRQKVEVVSVQEYVTMEVLR